MIIVNEYAYFKILKVRMQSTTSLQDGVGDGFRLRPLVITTTLAPRVLVLHINAQCILYREKSSNPPNLVFLDKFTVP